MDPDLAKKVLTVAAVVLAVAATLWLAFQIRNLLFMVFVSLFVAVAIEPPVHTLSKRGWSRGAATGLVFLGAFIALAVFVIALVPLLVNQVSELVNGVPGYIESVTGILQDWFDLSFDQQSVDDLGVTAQDWLRDNMGVLLGGVVGVGSSIFSFLFFFFTVALFSFYMVAEFPKLQTTVLSVLNQDRQKDVMSIWDTAVEKMGGYIYSRLILAIVGGTISAIFLTLLKVPFSLPLGIWVGVLSQFIPVVGTYLAAVLPAVVALGVSGPTALWVLVFFVLYQQVENYLIAPLITRRTMALHPAISVAAIIIGGALMGGVGIILALPMAAIIQAVISASIHRHEVVVEADAGVASD